MLRTVAALPGDEKFGHLPHDIDEDYLSRAHRLLHRHGHDGLARPAGDLHAAQALLDLRRRDRRERVRRRAGRPAPLRPGPRDPRLASGGRPLRHRRALPQAATGAPPPPPRLLSSPSLSCATPSALTCPAPSLVWRAPPPQPRAGHLQALGRHPRQAQGHRGGRAPKVQGGRDRRPREAGVALPAAVPVHGAVQVQGRRVHPADGHVQPPPRHRATGRGTSASPPPRPAHARVRAPRPAAPLPRRSRRSASSTRTRTTPESMPFDDRNLALPIGFNFPSSQKVAELFEAKFLEKSAAEWEAELEAVGLPCAVIQTWTAWMNDADARARAHRRRRRRRGAARPHRVGQVGGRAVPCSSALAKGVACPPTKAAAALPPVAAARRRRRRSSRTSATLPTSSRGRRAAACSPSSARRSYNASGRGSRSTGRW